MGNCLVTKLKKSVDNYNLSFFDCVSLRYIQRETPTDGSQWLRVEAVNGPVIIEALDGGTLSTTYGGQSIGSTFTVNANTRSNLYVSNHTGRIILHNKQNIKELSARCLELCKDFDYANMLESINAPLDFSSKRTLESIKDITLVYSSNGNFKNINQLENLTGFTLGGENDIFSGSLEDLSGCRNLEYLSINKNSQSSSKVGGNILSLVNSPLCNFNVDKNLSVIGDFENLAQCLILYYNKYGNITDVRYRVSSSGIGGSVQAFVNVCVDGGLTSGTINVPYFRTSEIYSDLEHTLLLKDDPNVAAAASSNTLSWSSDKTWTVS